MRVLIVSQEMPPETGWGGIGTYVSLLAPALGAAGADVRVLSVVRGQPASDRESGGLVVHRRPLRRPPGVGKATGLNQSWERLTLALAVDRELRKLDFTPDVVEAPEWRAEGLVIAMRRHPPVVTRLHSSAMQLFPWVDRPSIDARTAMAIERRAIVASEMVVSTHANLQSLPGVLRGRLRATRSVALPVAEHEAAAEPSGPPRVVFVGRLERVKNPETLLRAAPHVLERFPDVRFVFAGADTGRAPGSYRAFLERLAGDLGIAAAIDFIGHRPHDEILKLLAGATICAFPSRHETFGYGAAEAAALGRPVIASRIAAYADLFGARDGEGETGLLVPAEDCDAWGASICELLQAPGQAGYMGGRGRRRVRRLCAPGRVAAEMLAAYQEAAKK